MTRFILFLFLHFFIFVGDDSCPICVACLHTLIKCFRFFFLSTSFDEPILLQCGFFLSCFTLCDFNSSIFNERGLFVFFSLTWEGQRLQTLLLSLSLCVTEFSEFALNSDFFLFCFYNTCYFNVRFYIVVVF